MAAQQTPAGSVGADGRRRGARPHPGASAGTDRDPAHPACARRAVKRLPCLRGAGRSSSDGSASAGAAGAASLTVHSRYDQLPASRSARPAGRVGPPDFVILGAQKAGTTWWQGIVEDHPGVLRPPGQRMELHFFDHFWDRWPTDRAARALPALLPAPAGHARRREDAGLPLPALGGADARRAPRRMPASSSSSATPSQRYASGLGLLVRSGAIKGEIGAGEIGMREHRIAEAMERGRYAQQVDWFLRHFPRERLLLLQYERCAADPQGEAARTYAFLGLRRRTPSPRQRSSARASARRSGPRCLRRSPGCWRLVRDGRAAPARAHARPRRRPLAGGRGRARPASRLTPDAGRTRVRAAVNTDAGGAASDAAAVPRRRSPGVSSPRGRRWPCVTPARRSGPAPCPARGWTRGRTGARRRARP